MDPEAQSAAGIIGTAFAVSRTLAITALHCLKTRDGHHQQAVLLHSDLPGLAATLVESHEYLDVALLRLEQPLPDELVPLLVGGVGDNGAAFWSQGFPGQVRSRYPTNLTGSVAGPPSQLGDGAPCVQLLCGQATADMMLEGFSGAPVLLGHPENLVFGIIRRRMVSREDPSRVAGMTIYATPMHELMEVSQLLARSVQVHAPVLTPTVDAPTNLEVYRLDARWEARGARQPPPISDRYRTTLDVRVGLARGRSVTVVAGVPEPDLALHLNVVERSLTPLRAPRPWFTLAAHGLPPSGATDIRARVNDSRFDRVDEFGSWPGFVVPWPVRNDEADAERYVHALASVFPQAPVVVNVYGVGPIEVMDAAAGVARRVGASEVLVRPALVDGDDGERQGLEVSAGSVLGALTSLLRTRQRRYPHRRVGVVTAEALPAQADPFLAAEDFVAELNAGADDLDGETTLLMAIQDFLPEFAPAIMAEHARNRRYPGRCASLRAAARRDSQVDRWLAAADGDPATEYLALLDADTIDAVVLGLIRRGRSEAAVAAWQPYTSTIVRQIADQWRGGDLLADTLRRASAAFATAAERACIVGDMVPHGLPQAFASPACWSVVGRRRVTPQTAAWLATVPDTLLDALLRRLNLPGDPGDDVFDDHCRAFMPDLPPLEPRP
ncbi:trypsin-like peptidase domain-containing protein [Catellatospora citrea]|uniref:Trypsin-like peptidase n=1 Tax=Catellatospora citrea TaxID=53366 RepID=A0A8J3KHV1_9ACTN|nr:trypsin-like peptidase domain-containing protein [Catellatospora citrea]GIG00148.1 hypothetical protein Cci01nite_52410 [Catellatospora citrea]